MTLSFPLPIETFADKLRIESVSWRLRNNQELSGLGSGQILAVSTAPDLWEADVQTFPLRPSCAAQVQALLESLDGSINPFYLYNPKQKGPFSDPDGSILGASNVTIASLGADNKSMGLAGLPAGYKLSVGDFLAYDYGNPARRAYHRIVETVAAGSGGTTPIFEVRPHIRPGASVGLAVALVKPAVKCILQPGTLDVTTAGFLVTTTIKFSVIQRL